MGHMCRIAGYLGPPKLLSSLVDRPPHSLYKQSYAGLELETSVVSADGWGAAWYLPEEAEPALYRSTLPIWGDSNRIDLGRSLRSHCLLAAVRSATDPLGIAAANTQPFGFENLSFLHNGYIERFRAELRREVCERLSDRVYERIAGDTDSEHFFALLSESWSGLAERPSEQRLVLAVRTAVRQVRELVSAKRLKALVTLLVSDGERMVAVRTAQGAKAPTLYARHQPLLKQTWFASEPLDADEQGWQVVEEHSMLMARIDGSLESLSID